MRFRPHTLCHVYKYIILIAAVFLVIFVLFANLNYFNSRFSNMINTKKMDPESEWKFIQALNKNNKEHYQRYRSHLAEQNSKTNAINAHFIMPKSRSNTNRTAAPCNTTDAVPILILTPGKNMDLNRIQTYFNIMLNLTYSHCLIRVVIGVNRDEQTSIDQLKSFAKPLSEEFYSVDIISLNFTSGNLSDAKKHLGTRQLVRRSHIARVRNALLLAALNTENWVLWVDCDMKALPGDIIETLLSSQKDIIVPCCIYESAPGWYDVYDRNTWRQTEESLAFLKYQPQDFLMIEGSGTSLRKFLNELGSEGDIVPVDGVGGCCLLVHADVHRRGVTFPDFIFDHHIETEGFARMAQTMGYSMYGMPNVYVLHS